MIQIIAAIVSFIAGLLSGLTAMFSVANSAFSRKWIWEVLNSFFELTRNLPDIVVYGLLAIPFLPIHLLIAFILKKVAGLAFWAGFSLGILGYLIGFLGFLFYLRNT